MKNKIRFYLVCALFLSTLASLDRFFFKGNHRFSPYFLFSTLKPAPKWELPPQQSIQLYQNNLKNRLLTASKPRGSIDRKRFNINNMDPFAIVEPRELSRRSQADSSSCFGILLNQPFYYLGKGNRCFAFISEDQQYVIKFHRFPTHLRRFFAISHPLAELRTKWQQMKTLDTQKLFYNFQSYQNCLTDLKQETGLIYLQINPKDNLHPKITLIDSSQSSYQIPLEQTCFIVQHKAELIYPTLEQLILRGEITEAKRVISHIIDLIVTTCQKGYVHQDPVLDQNFGLLQDRAIYIDIGDLVKKASIENKEQYIPHIQGITKGLRGYLTHQPDLLTHYDQEIDNLWLKSSLQAPPALSAKG